MRRNDGFRFDPRQYKEHLSPFGWQVLGTLMKQWSESRHCNNSFQPQQQPHQNSKRYSHRRVLIFGEHRNETNDTLSEIENNEAHLNPDRRFDVPSTENCVRPAVSTTVCSTSTYSSATATLPPPLFRDTTAYPALSPILVPPLRPVPTIPRENFSPPLLSVPTSAELVAIAETSTKPYQITFPRELITPLENINKSRNIFDPIDYDIDNRKIDDTVGKARNVLEECRRDDNINWDDMFDSELLVDVNPPMNKMVTANKQYDSKNIQYGYHTKLLKDTHTENNKKDQNTNDAPDVKKSKRKDQTKVTDTIPKKVKKNKTEVDIKKKIIPLHRPRKITSKQAVKHWLNDVDSNNPIEDFTIPLEVKNQSNKIKDKLELMIEKAPEKPGKKIVQAQLANKGGIMKFGKPSPKGTDENIKAMTNTEAGTSEHVIKDKDNVKEKKPKTKFVAPIKSQVPVKDVTYEIQELNETTMKKLKLNHTVGQEIVLLMIYGNGFCQLNSHHTDEACVSEAVMFYTDDESYFYLKGDTKNIHVMLSQILQNITIVCYDGKALLVYLTSKFDLEFDVVCTFNIIDIKIAGSLLEPDKPPETFTSLQHLTESVPDHTISTTCSKQKAAWYATLLRSSANAARTKLEHKHLWEVFMEIEMKIVPIIADMEQRGVSVDSEKLKEMNKTLVTRMKQVESKCTEAAGRSFQINSTVQVRALLYDELRLDEKAGLKVRGTLTTGAKSTSETMLRNLVSLHPLPKLILEYRHLHKAHATFVQGIEQYVRGGIVRPVWIQTAAATGRIACSNPNLQAIPKAPFSLKLFPENTGEPGEEALYFRRVYVARDGYTLLAADWRHVECRVFARAAADTALQRALEAPDLFRRLAADWLKKPEEDISSADRDRTKRIVYASLYGAGTRKLMDILDVDYSQALSIASSFDRTFPSLRKFGRLVAAQCLSADGRVATLCGRTRTLPHITSNDAAQRSHAERQALNFIVQGTVADVCKQAMSASVRALRERGLNARLLLQIHDELVWEVQQQDLPEAAEVIRSAMEQCGSRAGLTSLPVALAAGSSWGEMTPYPPTDGDDCESQTEFFEI